MRVCFLVESPWTWLSCDRSLPCPEMWNYNRYFWVKLNRVVNSVVTLYGVGIIVYCLWLMKKWQEKTVGMPLSSFLARPLFIYLCLAIGIALCLSTMCGYIVVNCFSDCLLYTYLVVICCFLLLEVAVVITVYLRIDWKAKVDKYIDEIHLELRSFALLHIIICRIILCASLVPQISAIALAINLRAVGAHTKSACGDHSAIPDFRQSFLVLPDSRVQDDSLH